MSTLERKEYHETRVMRNRSPTRNLRSSNQNLAQFDSNLDNLLEDLQNSVSRPGSSLSHNYKETSSYGKTNSLNRISNVKASNPVTEYSSDDAYNYTSPDGREKIHGYKKEKYIYGKSTMERDVVEPERTRMQNSINQLDSLLDDLQQVKKSSYSESYNSSGIDSTAHRNVNRELHYGNTPPSSTKTTMELLEEKNFYTKKNENAYGALRTSSPTPSSKTSTLNKQTKVLNVHEYPIRVVETPVPDIDPEVLAHLDPNLHPAGNTKVTTTIKTYTYEIPGSGNYPTSVREDTSVNEQYLDKREKYVYNPNESITTPSKSFVYNKTENKENYYQQQQQPQAGWKDSLVKKSYKETIQDDLVHYPPYQKPTPPIGGHQTVKEEVTTIRNYQPGYQPELTPPSRNQTYLYNESTTTKNIQNASSYPPPPPPPESREYIINKETNVINRIDQQVPMSERGYPVYNPPQNGYQPPPRDAESYGQPPEPINIKYSYKSTNTTENRYKGGYSPETQNLLPRKFPTTDHPDGPPKGIDDLMASIGHEPPNGPLNAGFNAHEKDLANKKVIETLKNQQPNTEVEDLQKKTDQQQPTKNVSGPPVYYPPGHEMFSKKEEVSGGGGWRAQGGFAKGSGKYMYEAESGSKTKTKKGMAVVPICLPLCCGLPCTII